MNLVSGVLVLLLLANMAFGQHTKTPQPAEYDIIIYGGTSAGVAAAIQSLRMDQCAWAGLGKAEKDIERA